MNVNFNGYGENAATFIADKTLTEAGVPVKMKDNGTVAKCDASENFCGVCVSVRGGYAVVQLSGYVKVKMRSVWTRSAWTAGPLPLFSIRLCR